MNRYITVLILLLTSSNIFAQTQWQFKSKIEQNNSYLFEGTIGRYPITMYLEKDGYCFLSNRWNYGYRLKGWYSYNNRNIKLPLIGSEVYNGADGADDFKITLYVPINVLDSINMETCDLKKFREIFVSDCSFETIQWRMNNSKSSLPVNLKTIRSPSPQTEAFISLYIRDVEMFTFNLTDKLTDLKDVYQLSIEANYIESIELISSKAIDNDFYLIFSFSHPSIPSLIDRSRGYCGAGYEGYLGFLHISSFEVKNFKYVQTYSCFSFIEEEYTFDENAPEKGIMKIEN